MTAKIPSQITPSTASTNSSGQPVMEFPAMAPMTSLTARQSQSSPPQAQAMSKMCFFAFFMPLPLSAPLTS